MHWIPISFTIMVEVLQSHLSPYKSLEVELPKWKEKLQVINTGSTLQSPKMIDIHRQHFSYLDPGIELS